MSVQQLLDEITREFLIPELKRVGIEDAENYKIAYDMTPITGQPTTQQQLAKIGAFFRLAATVEAEKGLAEVFECLAADWEYVESRPALGAIVRKVYDWLEE